MRYWTTEDGRRLLLSEMSLEHLQNTAKMLRRKGFCSIADWRLSLRCLHLLQGEMAIYCAEQEFVRMKPTRMLDEIEKEIHQRRFK